MRLLICTQKMDSDDPVLGFFVRWVEAFAREWEHVHVVCLERGRAELPENVSVHSLGKEERPRSRAEYMSRFLRTIVQNRKEYDAVFVHMNQEYVLLGAPLWRLWGKRVGLWYNHTHGTLLTRLAMRLAHLVFHTSPHAYSARSKRAVRMPAGIDLEHFNVEKKQARRAGSVLSVGRIAPIKQVHTMIKAVRELRRRGKQATLDIYGTALPEDADYARRCREAAGELIGEGAVVFHGSVHNRRTPDLYRTHEVFVNLTPAGNYDKTVLEAMACGALTVASSPAFSDIIPDEYRPAEGDADELADATARALALGPRKRAALSKTFQAYVADNHSLAQLSSELASRYRHEKQQSPHSD